MSSDVEYGFRSLQVSIGASVLCGLCGYLAAKQLSRPFGEDSNKPMIFTIVGFGFVIISAVYAMFMIYRGSARTKMFALLALVISLAGSYGTWTVGWKKGGDPTAMKVF
jgi:hypothetical protein